MRRVCVFCGSSFGAKPEYAHAARSLGRTLAERRVGIVFGGSRLGLMGALADAALTNGGEVIGVIPEALMAKEIAHLGLTELRVVRSMHERKAMMADLADGFIALPGGTGTLEELFEIVTWAQLGMHAKPVAVINVAGYFDPLLSLLDHAVAERFVRQEHRDLVLSDSEIVRLLDRMSTARVPIIEKWIAPNES